MLQFVSFLAAMLRRDEETEGQGMVEYALILVLISIAAIALMRPLGVAVGDIFSQVTAAL